MRVRITCHVCIIILLLASKTGTAQKSEPVHTTLPAAPHAASPGYALLFATDQSVSVNPRQTDTPLSYRPLQELILTGARGNRLNVSDGAGKVYFSQPLLPVTRFIVAGALGRHTATILDNTGRIVEKLSFMVDARTDIDDGGRYKKMFDLYYKGMCVYNPDGVSTMDWNGRPVHFFVSWGLDNYHTLKGMQYFSPYGKGLTDILRQRQRADGMIWSFIASSNGDYFKTAYQRYGFYRDDGNVFFVRQPTENHVEYIYVNTIYKYWKGSGDETWMKENLSSAERALDYSMNDSLRWSARYQLLKRPLTIDSWDFQVDDEYTPRLGIGNAMLVEYGKTKFGIFYGDNTGYAQACTELADMLDKAGDRQKAERFRLRAAGIWKRLNALAWNGHFFTHFIDEDSSVHRHLGVDMRAQLSQSNAYSLNRGLTYRQDTAIIRTYLSLKDHLPEGAPAEWYAIYPPFQKGFGAHNAVWQYMNGGVGGHVAGELALGALDNGFEIYGVDILDRLYTLGKKYGDRIWFAYTGSFPSPPIPRYRTIDLTSLANMDLWDHSKGALIGFLGNKGSDGDDLRNLPVGDQTFHDISFHITDPEHNDRRSVLAISARPGYPKDGFIPVNDTAAAIYLLHDASGMEPDNVCASISLEYADSTRHTEYIEKGRQLSSWWFPSLEQDNAGVAWAGPNDKSARVGAYWAAIINPHPEKKIRSIGVHAAGNDAIYVLMALSLSDQPHYTRPKGESFGGPDNWAAATAMAALIEGLAGAKDKDVAYRQPLIAPRWIAAGVDSIQVTSRFAASQGYISYVFVHDREKRQIGIRATGNADALSFHVLLPEKAIVRSVSSVNGPLSFQQTTIGASGYVDFTTDRSQRDIHIRY